MNDTPSPQQACGRAPLRRTEEMRLARRAAEGDAEARTRLVESNLRLVVWIARPYGGLGVELRDLVQEGNIGHLAAVDKYDWARGVSFATYAQWSIRHAICRAISTQSRLVRVPLRVAQATTQVKRAERDLTQRLGRPPTCDEIAAAAGVSDDLV